MSSSGYEHCHLCDDDELIWPSTPPLEWKSQVAGQVLPSRRLERERDGITHGLVIYTIHSNRSKVVPLLSTSLGWLSCAFSSQHSDVFQLVCFDANRLGTDSP